MIIIVIFSILTKGGFSGFSSFFKNKRGLFVSSGSLVSGIVTTWVSNVLSMRRRVDIWRDLKLNFTIVCIMPLVSKRKREEENVDKQVKIK